MKTDIYKIENSIEKLLNGKSTFFLDQKEYKLVTGHLKKSNYKEYLPYKDSEKVILYTSKIPKVCLFRIKSYEKLRHQDILGSILSFNISPSYLGDIIVLEDYSYFYILEELSEFIKNNLLYIKNNKIELEELDLEEMANYERKYEKYEKIVSSLRIDNVISKIVGTNRDEVLDKIKDKEIILNNEILTKPTYILKENDTFSIRRVGKFKYVGIVNHTKKDNLIIKYLKYL